MKNITSTSTTISLIQDVWFAMLKKEESTGLKVTSIPWNFRCKGPEATGKLHCGGNGGRVGRFVVSKKLQAEVIVNATIIPVNCNPLFPFPTFK